MVKRGRNSSISSSSPVKKSKLLEKKPLTSLKIWSQLLDREVLRIDEEDDVQDFSTHADVLKQLEIFKTCSDVGKRKRNAPVADLLKSLNSHNFQISPTNFALFCKVVLTKQFGNLKLEPPPSFFAVESLTLIFFRIKPEKRAKVTYE